MKISVSRALTELKTIDSRIQKKINEGVFIAGKKKSSKKINNTHTIEEFNEFAKSSYDSVSDLIKRRKSIKSAIVNSNATTKIEIGGVEMTVAEAIERKSSIELEKLFLNKLERSYRDLVTQVKNANENVEDNLKDLLKASVGSDKKLGDMSTFEKAYRDSNEYEVIDPLKLADKIENLRKSIEDFEIEVDAILTESNVCTQIEIED